MIPVIHSWAEAIMPVIAIVGSLIYFERRLARLEAKVEILLLRKEGDE